MHKLVRRHLVGAALFATQIRTCNLHPYIYLAVCILLTLLLQEKQVISEGDPRVSVSSCREEVAMCHPQRDPCAGGEPIPPASNLALLPAVHIVRAVSDFGEVEGAVDPARRDLRGKVSCRLGEYVQVQVKSVVGT